MVLWVLLVVGGGGMLFFFHLYYVMWVRPERVRKKLRRQGIRGPPLTFLYGNVPEVQKIQLMTTAMAINSKHQPAHIVAHDYTSTLFPYLEQWRKQYGPVYTYSTRNRQHLYVNHPEMVKEMNESRSLGLGKPCYVTKTLAPMLGNGILRSNGYAWAHQRSIVAPQFFMEKVKGMVGLTVESTQPVVAKWEECIIQYHGGLSADVMVNEDLRCASADVISRACFGSSYGKGLRIFSKLRSLQRLISNQPFLFGLSTLGFLWPAKHSIKEELKDLEREVESLICNAVKERAVEKSVADKDLMLPI